MKHFTKNTLSAARWCRDCKRSTPHKVFSGRLDPHSCIPCGEKAEEKRRERLAAVALDPKQEEMFL